MELPRRRGPQTKLHIAAASRSLSRVKAVLASGLADINCGDPLGNTPLVIAADTSPAIVEILLAARANPNVPNVVGATALHRAAICGQLQTTRMLIRAGATLEATNENGCTSLQLAGELGHTGVVKALLETGAQIDSRSTLGETALYSAAYFGRVEATKELLRANANPLLGTVSGDGKIEVRRLPVDVAAQRGHKEVVHELLQLGVDACGASRGDALTLASKRQHVGTMAELRDAGVVDDGSALLTAASYRCEESVRFLINQHWATGAHRHAYVNSRDENGRTPLLVAVGGEAPRIARMLLDAGAIPDRTGGGLYANVTPLFLTRRVLEMDSFKGDRAAKDKRHRLEGLRRLLSRVDAISAVSWLWPTDSRRIAGAAQAGRATNSTRRTIMLPTLRESTRGISCPRRMVTARLLRWAPVRLPFPYATAAVLARDGERAGA